MELFHEYYSGQCQLVLDILARAKAESRFTRGELESIYGEDHVPSPFFDTLKELTGSGLLDASKDGAYLLGESLRPMRAPLPALERALAPDFYGLTLIDRTRLPRDLWARREEDALTGLFLQAMWDRCQELPDDPVCQLAARYGLAALEGGEEV